MSTPLFPSRSTEVRLQPSPLASHEHAASDTVIGVTAIPPGHGNRASGDNLGLAYELRVNPTASNTLIEETSAPGGNMQGKSAFTHTFIGHSLTHDFSL